MEEFDQIIKQELYFDMQEVSDYGGERFDALLLWIIGALQAGKSIREIKRYIKRANIAPTLAEDLEEMAAQQYEAITGGRKGFTMEIEALAGFTLAEAIVERNRSIERRARRFMAQAREALKAEEDVRAIAQNELRRYLKSAEQFWRDSTKAAREEAYAYVDGQEARKIRGWMSVAVLDNKTSAQCIALHNKFYSAKDYATRADVPDRPPRHPHCRSILVTVYEGVNITKYKGQNVETFLRRNPDVARDIMGIEKYRLWSGGKAKIDKYLDIRGKRWFRNDEIVSRLGIKSGRRLNK